MSVNFQYPADTYPGQTDLIAAAQAAKLFSVAQRGDDPERLLMALRAHSCDNIARNDEYIEAARTIIDEELYALRLFGIE